MIKRPNLTNYTDERIIEVIFLLFGIGVMAWVPRLPEVKDNLGLNNGQFGTIISTGGIGALVSLLTMGHVVHHIGTGKVIRLGFTLLALVFASIPHLTNPFLFLIINLLAGFAISTVHLSVNAQAFADQETLGRPIISKMHGMWAVGALVTAIFSSLLIGRISLAAHLGFLELFIWALALFLLQLRNETLLKPKAHKDSSFSITGIYSTFRIDYVVSAGLLCGVFIEFIIGDWASIFARDSIGIKSGLNALPYIIYTLTMIIGRLNANKIQRKFTVERSVKLFGILGGVGFATGIILSRIFVSENQNLAFIFALLGFAVGGFGASIMGPTFTNAAIERSNQPSSVVVGQIGVVNNISIWILKTIVAWTAQLTSLYTALLFPALMLTLIGIFAGATKQVQSK